MFLDLAVYAIIAENNAAQYYPDYAYNHPLFTNGMHIYSDSKVSTFLRGISRDDSIRLRNEWNEGRDHREKIYISYDSTNNHCQVGDIGLAEFGHEKEKQKKPIINFSIAYDKKNRIPLFYEAYPGSINDVDIREQKECLEKYRGTDADIDSRYTEYFDLIYHTDKNEKRTLQFVREKQDIISRNIKPCGYFCIITSFEMTAADALDLYKSRDASEKLFRGDKSYLGERSMRVYHDVPTHSKIFIEFVALIIRNKIYTCLKDMMKERIKRRTT